MSELFSRMDPQPSGLAPDISRFYRFADFTLDLREETLTQNGERLYINHRMFQVLLLLVERKGETVTKSEFFEKVWGGSFVEDNNLTVAITALRKVLGDRAKEARFIENVPRKGYRFLADVEFVSDAPASASDVSNLDEVGHSPTAPAGDRRRNFRVAILLALFVVAAAIIGLGSRSFWPTATTTKPNPAAESINSIAILPFSSDVSDAEYLADGLTEAVIDSLSRIPNLRVIDRNSAFQYKGKPLDALKAGRELNVRAVVTGKIEQQGDTIVLDIEMLDIAGNSQPMRQQFRRPKADLLTIQQEATEAIVRNAFPAAAASEQRRHAKRPTNDPEAYELYLKGRYYWNKRLNPDILRSVELFRTAIDRDPTFAMAYIGLSNAYTLGSFSVIGISDDQRIELSRGAVNRALEIDDTIGEAYASLAINKCYHEWDLVGAERDYRKAIELSPNDATAHHWYAEFLSMLGRFDESYSEYEKALSLDPLSMPIRTDMAFARYYARDYDKALDMLNLARQIDPEYRMTYNFLMLTYREKGMFLDAANSYEQYIQRSYGPNERSGKGYKNIMKHIAELQNIGPKLTGEQYWRAELDFEDDPDPIYRAVTFARLGDADNAFVYLEKAFKGRYSGMVWLKVTPELDGIRSDPRFADLLRRVGF